MFGTDLLTQSATIVGLLAGCIAVGGFLGHARPSMLGERESALRRETTVGGLIGMALGVGLIVLSVCGNLLS